MINRRFLNFKTYDAFKRDLNLIRKDAIVFIQEKNCIWAQGKEYVCDGPYIANSENGTLVFKNGKDSVIFSITQQGSTLEFVDSEGNTSSATYILEDLFNSAISGLYDALNAKADLTSVDTLNSWRQLYINNMDDTISVLPTRSELKEVAFTGSYDDLLDAPDIPDVDSMLSSTSTNPVQNKKVYEALNTKANTSDLNRFITSNALTQLLNTKQDVLAEGKGISIQGNTISSKLDTEVYIIVQELGDPELADSNKIYVRETKVGDDYTYQQYRVKDGDWVLVGDMAPTVSLDGYLRKEEADRLYKEAGEYLTSADLTPYALTSDLDQLSGTLNDYALKFYVDNKFLKKGNYALKDYVDSTFVKRSDVYKPQQGTWGGDGSQNDGNYSSHPNMVTLTVEQYEMLAANNLIESNTYYFTYEGEPETTEWHFGDTFPITFNDNTWGFGDQFPIVLTDGSTPDSIGTFPINLT